MRDKHRMPRVLSVLLTAALITSMDRAVLVGAQEPPEEIGEAQEEGYLPDAWILDEVLPEAEPPETEIPGEQIPVTDSGMPEDAGQEADAFPEDPGLLSQQELEEWIARAKDLLWQHQHDMACGYREAEPETACDKGCTAMDENGAILHSGDCTYRPAAAGGICQFSEEWNRRLEILTLTLQEKQQEAILDEEANKEESENGQLTQDAPAGEETGQGEDSQEAADAPEDSKGETDPAEDSQDGTGTTGDSQDSTEAPGDSQDRTDTAGDSQGGTDTDAAEDSEDGTEAPGDSQNGTETAEDSEDKIDASEGSQGKADDIGDGEDRTDAPEGSQDGTEITEDSSQEEPKKEGEGEDAETPVVSEDEGKGDETNAENEAETTEKTVDEEAPKETENQGEHNLPDNEPEYTIHIPAEVILNDTSTFTVETTADREVSQGAVIMTVTGTTARQESNDFALFLEGNEEIIWEYQLKLNHALVGPRQNQVILEPGNSAQEVEVVPVSPIGRFPAGTYRGSLSFQVAYKKGEAVQEKQISEETAQ